MASVAARAVLTSVRTYREVISPLRQPSCRYVPSCSAYAVEAVERFGAARGGYLALRRLLRCHPLHAGGLDPVPPPSRHGHGLLVARVEANGDAAERGIVTTRTSQQEFRP